MAMMPHGYGEESEFLLLKITAEEIEDYVPGSTFRPESEQQVFRKFRAICTENYYRYFFLKVQLSYFKMRYLRFSTLLNEEGIYWNKESNTVYGNMELLMARYPEYLWDGVFVGEKNFEFMCQIFESGVKFE